MTKKQVGHGLDRPELRPLWRALHHRMSAGGPVGRVRVGPLDAAGQEAVADLLGLDRLPGPRPTVRLAQLDVALSEVCGLTVRQLVAELVGPIGDRRTEREQSRGERLALWDWLAGHEVVRAQPALVDWAAQLRAAGLVDGSADRTRALLTAALAVLAGLPADGEPLPVLAARVVDGDSHALDDGTRLSTLVLKALAALHDTPVPEGANERRSLWGRAGVADDQLSSTVLTAGLRPLGDGPVARIARICADAAHPLSLTLAQLRVPGEVVFPAVPVHVTENPSVLALALKRFGSSCPPLVCTSGWPTTAVVRLLRLLAEHGAPLRYHGDFDGEGVRIAAYVMAKTAAEPWRLSAKDYRQTAGRVRRGPDLGRITPAPWDADLAPSLLELRIAVVEEVVADLLLEDLARAAGLA
ncbi:TIGR02679 family protein [Kitasatospora sp. NPDC093806]|uniref:TIGR02679 family protein n=1 Tax=Kitasatospora sp. NPDC093806 TaxID=3155075 RepID=UPI003418F56C